MESTTPTGSCPGLKNPEKGAVYLALVVMLGAFSVALLAAAPLWSSLIQRDKEADLIFRGEQYMRAIHAYQEEHGGAYPTDLKQLLELGPKQRRYIRRLFAEPMNPSGEWALLTQAMAQQTQVPGAGGQQGQNGQDGQENSDSGEDDDDDLFSDFGEPEEPPDIMSTIFDEDGFDGPITGQQGGPIVGVYCSIDKRGFRNYKGKENYREWKFNAMDLQQANQQQNQGQGQGQGEDGGQAGQQTRN